MKIPEKFSAAFVWSGERPRHSKSPILRAQSICCMTSLRLSLITGVL